MHYRAKSWLEHLQWPMVTRYSFILPSAFFRLCYLPFSCQWWLTSSVRWPGQFCSVLCMPTARTVVAAVRACVHFPCGVFRAGFGAVQSTDFLPCSASSNYLWVWLFPSQGTLQFTAMAHKAMNLFGTSQVSERRWTLRAVCFLDRDTRSFCNLYYNVDIIPVITVPYAVASSECQKMDYRISANTRPAYYTNSLTPPPPPHTHTHTQPRIWARFVIFSSQGTVECPSPPHAASWLCMFQSERYLLVCVLAFPNKNIKI